MSAAEARERARDLYNGLITTLSRGGSVDMIEKVLLAVRDEALEECAVYMDSECTSADAAAIRALKTKEATDAR